MDEIRIVAAILASDILSKGVPSTADQEAQYAVVILEAIEKQLRQLGDTGTVAKS